MPITYNVHSGVQLENDIRFTLEVTPDQNNIKAGERMITDSDSLSFVYLLEDDDGYHYVKFGQEVWPLLVNTLKAGDEPTLQFGNIELTLLSLKKNWKCLFLILKAMIIMVLRFQKQ